MKILYKISSVAAFFCLFVGFVQAQAEREKGIELYKQGKNEAAVAALEKASSQTKTDGEVWNYLGLAYLRNESFKKAVKAIEKAVSLNPQSAIYQTNLAYVYYLSGKLDKARDESAKALLLNPQSADAYYVRGSANLLMGKIR
jgi:Flp pilus assembly protein TadD